MIRSALIIQFIFGILTISISANTMKTGIITGGRQGEYKPTTLEELRVRGGLPNIFSKLEAGKKVCIAYLGGSITHAEGWRVKTFDWLKGQYPKAELAHIDAAVSGTGADFAACRLSRDLLPHNPDLVFVEFRVNLGGGVEARAIEGVVRQIWKDNPETDICFVYTLGEWMIDDLSSGKQFFFGEIMERMANVYGIPSIDFGVEVINQLKEDKLTFKADASEEGKLHFSKDGVHPIDAGHELYARIVARSFETMKDVGVQGPHMLPEPTVEQTLDNARLLPISVAKASKGWKPVDSDADEIYCSDTRRTGYMLNRAVKTDKEGETLSITWTGTELCLTHIPQGEGMEIEIVTDGGETTHHTFKQDSDTLFYARFAYLPKLKQGKHTTIIKVTNLPEETSFYCGQMLVLSDPE